MEELRRAWESIVEVAAAPGANLKPALLLGAVVFLSAIIALVAALLVVVARRERRARRRARLLAIRREQLVSRRRAAERAPEGGGGGGSVQADAAAKQGLTPVLVVVPPREGPPRPLSVRGRRLNTLLTLWLPVLAVVGVAVGLYGFTGSDRYCADYCHGSDPVTVERASTAHASVACSRCHEDPAPGWALASASTRLLHLAERAELVATTSALPVLVPSRRCLSCHERALSTVVEDRGLGVRMSHKEVLAAGMACDDCHAGAGHTTDRPAVPMTSCLPCHDSVKASSECRTCHIGDPSSASAGRRLFSRTNLGVRTDCGGCHDQRPCDTCHGLRLPHPAAFVSGGHARTAAFDGKRACFACHAQDECSTCHLVPAKIDLEKPWGHPRGWESAHAKGGRAATCSCHEQKRPAPRKGEPFCTACHGPWQAR